MCRIMLPIHSINWPRSTQIAKNFEKYLIEKLRIRGAIVFPFEVKDSIFPETLQMNSENHSHSKKSSKENFEKITKNWNELIKALRIQNKTVVSFFYLPKPCKQQEKDHHHDDGEDLLLHESDLLTHASLTTVQNLDVSSQVYLEVLRSISSELGPVLFVHGIHNVIQTVF